MTTTNILFLQSKPPINWHPCFPPLQTPIFKHMPTSSFSHACWFFLLFMCCKFTFSSRSGHRFPVLELCCVSSSAGRHGPCSSRSDRFMVALLSMIALQRPHHLPFSPIFVRTLCARPSVALVALVPCARFFLHQRPSASTHATW